jgi:hypothetical protein
MLIRKTVRTSEGWTPDMRQQAVAYWRERGFVFSEPLHAEEQIGRRGSFWGNLTSFDMSKLRATLTITRVSPTEAEFVMDVDTSMQSITEWNQAYWRLEMDIAESWLLRGDKQEAEWQEFDQQWRRAARLWCVTFGVGGNKMPPPR